MKEEDERKKIVEEMPLVIQELKNLWAIGKPGLSRMSTVSDLDFDSD